MTGKAFLFNPPVGLFQRGEDRCQGEIETSAATTLRPPLDLAYMAAVLRREGLHVALRDYPAEGAGWPDLKADLRRLMPDLVVMSITTATLVEDMKAFDLAKQINPQGLTVAKGAHFFTCNEQALKQFSGLDVAIRGEADTLIDKLWTAHQTGTDLVRVDGIIFRDKTGNMVKTSPVPFFGELDRLPLPARDLLRNELYTRPDTGAPMTTVQVSRGCPSQCIFCLSPSISGQILRLRSPNHVVDELEECINRHGIRDFFFRADTFTIDQQWVIALCQEILKRGLDIAWVANSKVNTIDEKRLSWMKRAGCWLVALGIESGNEEIQKRIKKGATVDQARRAVQLCKRLRVKTYGFYLIGLPWDNRETVQETITLAKELDCDFSEIHIAIPYEGTELYTISRKLGLIDAPPLGHSYFTNPVNGTLTLSRDEVLRLRKQALKSLYFNPRFVVRTLKEIRSPSQVKNYARLGWRLVKNLLVA